MRTEAPGDRSKPVTIAVYWPNRWLFGATFLFGSAVTGATAFTKEVGLAIAWAVLSAFALAGAVIALRSGRVQVDPGRLLMTSSWRWKSRVIERSEVVAVVINKEPLNLLGLKGRRVLIKLADGGTLPMPVAVADRRGPDSRVEGLADRLRAWLEGQWPLPPTRR